MADIASLGIPWPQRMVSATGLLFEYPNTHDGQGEIFRLNCEEFSAPTGIITGVIGANGSGKTTLLRILAGQHKPHRGEVFFFDMPLANLSKEERQKLIGWIHTDNVRLLIDDVMVIDHVALSLLAKGKKTPLFPRLISIDWIESQLEFSLTRPFDLSGLYHSKVRNLSTGQRQGLGNVLGFVKGQRLLIADEGTATLDVIRSTEFAEWLKILCSEMNLAVVFSSHDLRLVAKYCERAYILNKGNVSMIDLSEARDLAARIKVLEEQIEQTYE